MDLRRYLAGSLLTLLLPLSNAIAAPNTNGVPLWAQMQKAVLKDQDLNRVKELIKSGFDINGSIGCGSFNSVDGAISCGNLEMLNWLLKNGAKAKGWSLLQAQWCKDQDKGVKMTEALLSAGANANYVNTNSPGVSTPLHVACYMTNTPAVALLLKHGCTNLNVLDVDGRTPLMWAMQKKNFAAFKMLMAAGADPTIKCKISYETPYWKEHREREFDRWVVACKSGAEKP